MPLTSRQIQKVRQATRAVESVDLHALEKLTTPDSYGRPAVAFGKPVDSAGVATDFPGGKLIWLDPCEQDGRDIPGLALVHCHLAADKRFSSASFLKTDVIRFAWYPIPETGSDQTNGIVLGLSDDSVSFGKPTATFTTGATITLDPCDQAGADLANGVNVVCHLAADKSVIPEGLLAAITTSSILRFARYPAVDGDGAGGVLLGLPPMAMPASDGTFFWKCVRTAGVSVLSWQVAEECP